MRSISPERWRRIEPLLEEALELKGAERERFLERSCGADERLREEITELLNADANAEHLLSKPLGEQQSTLLRRAFEDVEPSPPPRSADHYPPGTILGGRFRILNWIGRGGMGEVFRADDLKLGQPVALKFLPREAADDPDRLERFLNEVRMALKVSHPNVTRIHDIGEVDGQHFISMQYVDGEDLASLLRRIGRLPSDKATQVARQLCAGLAAAHDQGVLHRDLKPANVMIDGRGQVKITDFGLAALDETVRGGEARAGTPGYMAPEQWAGQEVTRRSDLYALGLVLYELFTGQAAFGGRTAAEIAEAHRTGTSTAERPSTLVEGLDPTVERVILQCLEAEPSRRPVSALAVAAALPGGDPLAAALAAGETPSPEMVAQAATSVVSPRLAWFGFVATLLLLGLAISQAGSYQLAGASALSQPPEVLAHEAREILEALGHESRSRDRNAFFLPDAAYLRHILQTDSTEDRWRVLGRSQPAAYRFWYHQSRNELARIDPSRVDNRRRDPPLTDPGMVEMALDSEGRLLSLTVVPDRLPPADAEDRETDWGALFDAAGLDPALFATVEPSVSPPVFADRRGAWEGVFPEAPEIPLRVEAASRWGRPVYFRMLGPWDRETLEPKSGRWKMQAFRFVWPFLWLATLIVAVLVAARNHRRGSGDLRTARRCAVVTFGLRLSWLLAADHFASGTEIELVTAHLAQATVLAGAVWVVYLALEPYIRRLWPRVLTTWVRLFDGQLRDPLVGRDLLIGVLVGLVAASVRIAGRAAVADQLGQPAASPLWSPWTDHALMGVPGAIAALAAIGPLRHVVSMGLLVLLTALRLATGRTWVAVAGVSLFVIMGAMPNAANITVFLVLFPSILALQWAVFLRVGFLSYLIAQMVTNIVWYLPLELDLSAWTVAPAVTTITVLLGVAGWGFYHALTGRSVFSEELPAAGD